MQIAEIFASIQGEGLLAGTPSAFVRTSGCNLRCTWCDTPYTSWRPEGTALSVDAIAAAVARLPESRHVVITGGEPLIAPELPALVEALRRGGERHVTIETAGTVHVPVRADLWSISPKLANSTPAPHSGAPAEPGEWTARHEERRRRPDVVRRLMDSGDYQLKFVIGAPTDLDEVLQFLEEIEPVERDRVLLMPQARSVAELDAAAAWLPELCRRHGVRFGDRLHIRLFGNTRST